MDDTITQSPQETALARFAVIAPLVLGPQGKAEAQLARRAILDRPHPFPDGSYRQISERTLRRWVAEYRAAFPDGTKAALDALHPAERSDKGVPRTFEASAVDEAVKLKIELPTRSVADIAEHLAEAPKETTLAYHLRQRGATRAKLKIPAKAFRRFEAKAPNALWQSDVLDGLSLPDPTCPEKFKKAHLVAFIDDYSRLVPHGEWYFRESLPCLFDAYKKAVLKHGCVARLYWDNGPAYRSRQIRLVAARLGTRVIYSTPYAPEGRGKIERFFRTVSRSFVKEAEHAQIATLEELNKAFWAWLERYHHRKHRSTKMTPWDRWQSGADQIRYAKPAEIQEIFLWEDDRLVSKTATVSLAGNEYRVDDALVGQTVQVRYDPLDLATVRIYTDKSFRQVAEPDKLVTYTHRQATPHRKEDKYLPLPSSRRLMDKLVAEHKATAAAGFAASADSKPDRHPDDLDTHGFAVTVGQLLGRALGEAENLACERFFRRYAPIGKQAATTILADLVATKGRDRHLDFYLGELALGLRGRP